MVALAVIAAAVADHSELRSGPLRGSSPKDASDLVLASEDARALVPLNTKACSKLWDQCGGEGYSGATCCEEGSDCLDYALENLPSYRQCRLPEAPACGEPE